MHALPVCIIICYLMLIQCNECVYIIDSFIILFAPYTCNYYFPSVLVWLCTALITADMVSIIVFDQTRWWTLNTEPSRWWTLKFILPTLS